VGYDVIVVGGGSAGCVVAARLSVDERCSVLLAEAGPDYPVVADLPADIADGWMPATSHEWGFVSEPDELGHSIPLPRGRLIGGCSATNACFALRGWPQDYDQWAARGNPGWSFAELLPVFRAIESDADFGGDWHGSGGPVPIRRPAAGDLSPLQRAFADAAVAAGHPLAGDHNQPGAIGVGPSPRNVREGLRMSTALTHLATARGRPNLTIRAGTTVDRVELRGTFASRRTRRAMLGTVGGRPDLRRLLVPYLLAASLRYQVSSVAGATAKTSVQRLRGMSWASAANHTRSAGSYRTRPAWRRSTVFSCRSTSSSASFARSVRDTRTAKPSIRRTSR